MASELGYRVYRLRRLIAVCLGLVGVAVTLGIWWMPGPSTALHAALAGGLFSIFAMAHLAIILLWPTDAGVPLCSAVGTVVLLAVLMPVAAYQLGQGATPGLMIVLAVMLGPIVWLVGAPLIGGWIVQLIAWPFPPKAQVRRITDLPVDLSQAMALFAPDPDKKRALTTHGPLGWDGGFDETSTRLVADTKTGVIAPHVTINRFRPLGGNATTRAVLIIAPNGSGPDISAVMHQEYTPLGQGTRLTEMIEITGAPRLLIWTAWLMDLAQDQVTAELDAAAGRPPRALVYLPLDTLWLAMTRFFKWGDPSPG